MELPRGLASTHRLCDGTSETPNRETNSRTERMQLSSYGGRETRIRRASCQESGCEMKEEKVHVCRGAFGLMPRECAVKAQRESLNL